MAGGNFSQRHTHEIPQDQIKNGGFSIFLSTLPAFTLITYTMNVF